MEEALNKRDLDALLANVDDNVAFTAMNAEAGYGKQHIRNYFDRMLNGPNKIVQNIKVDFVPDQLSVFYGPDMAVSAGNAASHYELTNGLKFDINARWTATLVRKEGRWLVGAFHYSANVFRNPIMDQQRKFMLMAGGGMAIVFAAVAFIVGRRRAAPVRDITRSGHGDREAAAARMAAGLVCRRALSFAASRTSQAGHAGPAGDGGFPHRLGRAGRARCPLPAHGRASRAGPGAQRTSRMRPALLAHRRGRQPWPAGSAARKPGPCGNAAAW